MTHDPHLAPDLRGNSRARSYTAFTGSVAAVLMAAVLQGCTSGGKILDVTGQITNTPGGATGVFYVVGEGTCEGLQVDFGDGTPPLDSDQDNVLTPPGVRVSHSYTGWGGKKTVTAKAVSNCTGSAKRVFVIGKPQVIIGLKQPTPTACAQPSPNLPPLRKGSLVLVTTTGSNVRIDFGCALGGCVHDADGILNSTADPSYPFPGFRALSLVIRVGTQIVQGGTNVSFTTNQAGPLELCVNDNNLTDNGGAWGIVVEVDESGIM